MFGGHGASHRYAYGLGGSEFPLDIIIPRYTVLWPKVVTSDIAEIKCLIQTVDWVLQPRKAISLDMENQ